MIVLEEQVVSVGLGKFNSSSQVAGFKPRFKNKCRVLPRLPNVVWFQTAVVAIDFLAGDQRLQVLIVLLGKTRRLLVALGLDVGGQIFRRAQIYCVRLR